MYPQARGGKGETKYVGWEATKAGMIHGKGILLQKELWASMCNMKESGEMEQNKT